MEEQNNLGETFNKSEVEPENVIPDEVRPVNPGSELKQEEPVKTAEPHVEKKIKAKVHQPKDSKLNIWKIATVVLVAVLLYMVFLQKPVLDANVTGGTTIALEGVDLNAISKKAFEYVNDNLLAGQAEATMGEVVEENGLVKMTISVNGQEIDSYVTKDGRFLFPQGIDMDEPVLEPELPPPAEVVKSDKPKIELFVMSHCPYGTQAEKGIIPVVEKLGDKIDFSIKFVDYAMHGKKELDEQTKQVCMMELDEDKYYDYLKCFLDKGDAGAVECAETAGFDADELDTCIEETDEEFGITEAFENQSTWSGGRFPAYQVHAEEGEAYGVGGSPTLVVNGEKASSGRSPAAYLGTICAAFNEAPEECDAEMDATNPSPGFGYGVGSAGAAAAECDA
jgi:hypothetical protein